jgi:protein gp37
MHKSKIEYVDYTWNPIRGYCPGDCPYCYAHRMYNRFKWNPKLRFDVHELKKIHEIEKPSRIFVGSMIDMYHEAIPEEWVRLIIKHSQKVPEHTYITLTKFPQNIFYSKLEFPHNWWVGVTIVTPYKELILIKGARHLNIISGKVFVSFEPLLNCMDKVSLGWIDWIIIGGLTPKPAHKKEWIDSIVDRARIHQIPVFIKDNAHYPINIQEFPD